jgi:hypothetical protein
MSLFETYLRLGFYHICDIHAYDHLLFILVLCGVYPAKEFKKVLWLVTAFTLGHSLTLALSSLNVITFSQHLIEAFIPITILLTASYNVMFYDKIAKNANASIKNLWPSYALTLFFGLIHGMGFSNYFSMLLGKSTSITFALLSFNIGVEIGQVLIVGVIFAVSFTFLSLLKVKRKRWNILVSAIAALIAIKLLIDVLNA